MEGGEQDPRESFEAQMRVVMAAMNEKKTSLRGNKQETSRGSGLDTDKSEIRAEQGGPSFSVK